MEEEDQLRFGFDLLDPTKIVPEDIVPFTPLGKLTLNRNPLNYFSETEYVSMYELHVRHILTSCTNSKANYVPSGSYCKGHRLHR
jgi:catalase